MSSPSTTAAAAASSITVLGFADYAEPAARLAQALRAPLETVEVHRFPDGESRLRLPQMLAPHVVVCRSLDHPNDKLIELLLVARTARELGAQRLTLVAPYLCYMRQDIAFQPGEAVSQRIVGRFLADLFDTVITVDPHLHRISRLDEAIPARRAVALSTASVFSTFLAGRVDTPLLLGPDAESEQWVYAIAEPNCLDFGVASKVRRGDCDVQIRLPHIDLRDRAVVLVDDVASTGCTLAVAAREARAAGAAHVYALITHALCTPEAMDRLRAAGVEEVWSTDSVPHPTNVIALAELLARAV